MNWKKTLNSVAPTLAAALGGPVAGAATKFLADKLLGDESASLKDVENAIIGASPETLSSLKEIDNQFKVEMEKLGVDVFKLEVDDKKNARENNKNSYMPAVLSVSLTLIIGVLLYALFYIEPPEGAREPLLIVLGMVVKEWSNSMHYWFGTTRSSADKTRMLSK